MSIPDLAAQAHGTWMDIGHKHVSGLAGLGEHVFITAIGLNQRMFWLK